MKRRPEYLAPDAELVRDGDWEFLFGTDAAEFTEHSAKDQGGTKLGNTHRHILLVEKIRQGRFPSPRNKQKCSTTNS